LNVQEYISSGIIESYVLGLSGEEEARELEELCVQYPEIKAAVREAEAAMEEYAQLNAISPPEYAKEKIWSTLSSLQEKEISPSEDSIKPISEAKPLEPNKKTFHILPFISKAAVILLLIGLPYHFYKVNQYQKEILILQQEKNEIMAQNQVFSAQIQEVSQELDIVSDPSTRPIVLAGVEGFEENQARVYWRNSGEVYLKSSGLAALPEDKQYQLWAIVEGQPVSVGLLEQDESVKLQQMNPVKEAEMFAITIENVGGSKQPTLDQMVVAGKTV
jgi:anti-sigma-K factor RskA